MKEKATTESHKNISSSPLRIQTRLGWERGERSREIWRKSRSENSENVSLFFSSFLVRRFPRQTNGMFMLMRICSLIHILDLILTLRYMNHKKRDSEFISWNYKRRHKIFYHFGKTTFGRTTCIKMLLISSRGNEMELECSGGNLKCFMSLFAPSERSLFIFEDFRSVGLLSEELQFKSDAPGQSSATTNY